MGVTSKEEFFEYITINKTEFELQCKNDTLKLYVPAERKFCSVSGTYLIQKLSQTIISIDSETNEKISFPYFSLFRFRA